MLYFENIYEEAYIGQTKQRIQRRVADHRATAIKNKTLKQKCSDKEQYEQCESIKRAIDTYLKEKNFKN